jgi:Stage II sporulation protein E (SpoIIE)
MTEIGKSLFQKVEGVLGAIERSSDVASTVVEAATAIVGSLRDELGVRGGRLYERIDGSYEITRTFGDVKHVARGLSVPLDYPPLEQVLDQGVVVLDLNAPGVDRSFEERIGADRFAAIAIGEEDFILSFDVDPQVSGDDIKASLGIVRRALDGKIREERLATVMEEARQIQLSILPKRKPRYGDFDLAGQSRPAEIVGGDFYDFIPVSDQVVGVAIADASGHGLPAALQVRDVYTGLRMGTARDFKIIRTLERLNRIIHHSRMTTKFVSLFYGELEVAGNFIYVNAGHTPPLFFSAAGVQALAQTGIVLGPSPDATYSRGFVRFDPGDVLVLFTDGIVEARGANDEEFGVERLKQVIDQGRDRSAEAMVAAVFAAVDEFSLHRPPEDDRTVVVVRRAARAESGPPRPGAGLAASGTPAARAS